jgi:hypothetical protein
MNVNVKNVLNTVEIDAVIRVVKVFRLVWLTRKNICSKIASVLTSANCLSRPSCQRVCTPPCLQDGTRAVKRDDAEGEACLILPLGEGLYMSGV